MKISRIAAVFAVVLAIGVLPMSAKSRFGIRAGLNVNEVSYKGNLLDNLDVSNRKGATAGIVWESNSGAGMAFEAGVNYTRMNSEINNIDWGSVSGETWTKIKNMNTSMDFIEIPLYLKYKLGLPFLESIFMPMVYTGPSVSFKVDEAESILKTKNVLVGWGLGAGVQVLKHIQLSAHYTMEINEFFDKAGTKANIDTSNFPDFNKNMDVDGKFKYWTITATYFF